MPANRYYSEQLFSLQGPEFHHLTRVMRAKVGDSVEVVNGKGELAYATIEGLGKREASLHIDKVVTEERPSSELILAQAIPRLNRLDFILEKGTELGMTEIWLFPATLSERKKLTDQQQNRLHNIAIAAMKQSGRLFLPEIKLLEPLTKWREIPQNSYFGDLDPEAPRLLKVYEKKDSTALFIGPESGFTEEEAAFLKAKGALGVKLHPNILRTDTAALTALAIVNA